MNIIVDEQYLAHENGTCGEGCKWCILEDELNEDYSYVDKKKEKKSLVSKLEKGLKKL